MVRAFVLYAEQPDQEAGATFRHGPIGVSFEVLFADAD